LRLPDRGWTRLGRAIQSLKPLDPEQSASHQLRPAQDSPQQRGQQAFAAPQSGGVDGRKKVNLFSESVKKGKKRKGKRPFFFLKRHHPAGLWGQFSSTFRFLGTDTETTAL
jgi:hypothetical protein